ncbi:MAG: DUF4249 domain-containing protein [Parabacteroides sp.]|nr:DUF4249 domain-containing protein [Parabacteroides sp.]
MIKKKFKYSCILLLIVMLIQTSCTRDVILELPYASPSLVLNASVTTGEDVTAYLSKSWFLLDSVMDSEVSGGKISVYVNDVYRGTMQNSDIFRDSVFTKGRYILPGCLLNVGDRLRLEAEADGFDAVYAETQMPDSVQLLSIDTVRFISSDKTYKSQEQMRLYINFVDGANKKNYYRLSVEKVIEKWRNSDHTLVSTENSFGSSTSDFYLIYEDPVFQYVATNPTLQQQDATNCWGTFSDDMFNGNQYTLKSVFYPIQTSYIDSDYTYKVYYDVRLMSISEEYYNYLTVIRNISVSFGEAYINGLLEPSATYTNVEGGFGVVAGYQVAYKRIVMPFGKESSSISE